MNNLKWTFTQIESVITLFILSIILVISYLIKRNGFYINKNCWFCNGWTKVLYADRNSFHCPLCLQYNGFNKDGGYNKVIEAQFDTSFAFCNNKPIKNNGYLSNGLCIYCNNNQQLKVRQLANFVPMKEENYDIEIEHFRTQLEKSYKLCRKCDQVLKKTLQNQNACMFADRIKNSYKKGSNKLKTFSKQSKMYLVLNIIRYILILFSFIILCRSVYPEITFPGSMLTEYIPDKCIPYVSLLNHWYHVVSNAMNRFIRDMISKLNLTWGMSETGTIKNDILPIIWLGLILDTILMIWQHKSVLWKVNELLSWIILAIISLNIINEDNFVYINTVQILSSLTVFYSLSANKFRVNGPLKKGKRTLKKLKKNQEKLEVYSDDDNEIFEETLNAAMSTSKKPHMLFSNTLTQSYHRPQSQKLYQNPLENTANSDNFMTARSTKCSSLSHNSSRNNSSSDELNHSLDNLHLSNSIFNSNLNFTRQSSVSPVLSVRSADRPILSPPKLKNITQNSWAAGGFWKNDLISSSEVADNANFSCSSSQSSGFVSNNDAPVYNLFNSMQSPREHSLHGELEKASIFAESAYHFKPIKSSFSQFKDNYSFNASQSFCSPLSRQLYYKADNNLFYPAVRQSNLLHVQGNIPNFSFENNFGNLSLRNGMGNTFISPTSSLHGGKPVVSSLFKNLDGVNPETYRSGTPFV